MATAIPQRNIAKRTFGDMSFFMNIDGMLKETFGEADIESLTAHCDMLDFIFGEGM